MSDVVLRKKKNADAQAAFRARRANYIATLEETVTALESVVLQLQESCRESKNEANALLQDNKRLRFEQHEREKLWRAFVHAAKNGQALDTDQLPPPLLSSPFWAPNPQSSPLIQQQQHPFPNGIPYRQDSIISQSPYPSSSSFPGHSSSAPFSVSDGSSNECTSSNPHRATRYAPYPYPVHRDQRWNTLPNGPAATPPSQSPSYVGSPSVASTEYPSRFTAPGEDQKVALNSVLENAPYVFPNGDRFHQSIGDSVPNSRSISPTTSTPNSSTSMSLTSSFPYTFPESSSSQVRSDFDYRRHSLPHCPEVTLHGGTADISLSGQASESLRYRMRGDDHQQIMSPKENNSRHEQGSSDGDHPVTMHDSRRQPISAHSGSPSPGPAPISCTVAVIKAQAFGALRRTRAKAKKTSEGASRVTKGVLESRGIGVEDSAKSKRLPPDNEYDDAEAS